MDAFLVYAVPVLRVLNDILTAAVAMTAFSFILFSLQFMKRKRKLAWAFVPFLGCMALIYSADALEATTLSPINSLLWQKINWSGFILLPAVFLTFSGVVLSMTGMEFPIRKPLTLSVLALISSYFLWQLWTDQLFAGVKTLPQIGNSMIAVKKLNLYWCFFAFAMCLAFLFLGIAFSRTRTRASRRRMTYMIVGSAGSFIGTFPLLLFGSGLEISRHILVFWVLSVLANLAVEASILLLGYSVTSFSVPWSDRSTRQRMFEWLMRGPATAILTLGFVILVNRGTGLLGLSINGLSSMIMVLSIICCEYLISFLLPLLERTSLVGYGKEDYAVYSQISEMMVFKAELSTFLEALTGALCDRFQADEGFFAARDENGQVDPFIRTAESRLTESELLMPEVWTAFEKDGASSLRTDWGALFPVSQRNEDRSLCLGVVGLSALDPAALSEKDLDVIDDALEKARGVLWQRHYLMTAYQVLNQERQESENDAFRGGNLLDREALLPLASRDPEKDVTSWVKDALSHYWGGPKFTENPLMEFRIVREEIAAQEGNAVKGLRNILRSALERLRPGETREFTGEWTLYNIIDLKYFEKLKVKEITARLSMSEADYYRKQKLAVEALAKSLLSMEHHQTEERNEKTDRVPFSETENEG